MTSVSRSAFKQSLPVVFTSFINRMGTIGLSLLPMILVQKQYSIAHSSWFMAVTEGSAYLGTLLGGFLGDRFGGKKSVLVAFFLSAIGLGTIPFAPNFVILCLGAMIAQVGNNLFAPPLRMLVVTLVDKKDQQEAIGWLRTANNMGQIVSFGIGALFTQFGLTALILFDAATSLIAVFVGYRLLPEKSIGKVGFNSIPKTAEATALSATLSADLSPSQNSLIPGFIKSSRVLKNISQLKSKWPQWRLYVLFTVFLSLFSLVYQMYMTGASAKFQVLYGADGLRIFSLSMVINTIFCSLFSVFAAKKIKNPNWSLPIGFFLLASGCIMSVTGAANKNLIFAGAFILTLGEIIFGAIAVWVTFQLIPTQKNQTQAYSYSVVLRIIGSSIGGALAFPLLTYGTHPTLAITLLSLPGILLYFYLKKDLEKKLGFQKTRD